MATKLTTEEIRMEFLLLARKGTDKIRTWAARQPHNEGTIRLSLLRRRLPMMGLPIWAVERWSVALTDELMMRAQAAVIGCESRHSILGRLTKMYYHLVDKQKVALDTGNATIASATNRQLDDVHSMMMRVED